MYRTMLAFETLLPDEPVALDLSHLYTHFHTLHDQRARRGVRYPLPLLLMVALLAKLTRHTQVRALAQWAALRPHELARLFHFPGATMPHGVTWSRVLGTAVDLPAFEQLLGAALNPLDAAIVPARASIALAIDGNTLRCERERNYHRTHHPGAPGRGRHRGDR